MNKKKASKESNKKNRNAQKKRIFSDEIEGGITVNGKPIKRGG